MFFKISGLTVRYGKIAAVRDVSLQLDAGEIITIIGANGAGKSTTLRTVSGLKTADSGEIWFDGERIDRLPPEKIIARGIAHVPEGRRVFPSLTVLENLYTGAFLRRDKAKVEADLEEVFVHFPRLKERRHQAAKTMSGGEQQMLAMGRALMSRPRLLLMDEPSLGLAPIIVQEIARIVVEINTKGVPVILVEQNAKLALKLADRAYVMETGGIVLSGPANELRDNDHVRKAYLGG
ncbi:Branched-chain amino acid transport ATP-binding protein LivF (TC 3.A.1.4.1) [hydrothermal vent metagenome]|uniref:Branched-chain amino acid transport ATP-binding protein LivF (TC 3.A.1.4.1) n=1 Tax=hydrothermal vent metagenome TaxID=652676 RepID=A0A3B0SB68_9ZZZZ